MALQFGILFVVMAIALYYGQTGDDPHTRKKSIWIITGVMTCFSGFRSWWMGDLIKYYTLYSTCFGDGWQDAVFGDYSNMGIRIFFWIVGSLGIKYEFCIFAIAAFSAVTLGILVEKYSPSIYWSYLIYIGMGFYIFTYSGLKQTIAMGFICLAMISILERRPVRFILWVLIAVLFHSPAGIFIIAYPIANKHIDRFYVLILIAIVAGVFLFREQIMVFLSDAYYSDEEKFEANGLIGGRFIVMVAIIGLGIYLRPVHDDDVEYRKVFNIIVIAALLQSFSIYNNVFTRLADYYYQFAVLYFPFILEDGTHQAYFSRHPRKNVKFNNRIIYIGLYIGITVFAIWFYYNQVKGDFVETEYKFFWQIDEYQLYGH